MKCAKLVYDFDFVGFMNEVERAAAAMDLRMADLSRDTGIAQATLCDIRKGKSTCNARILMALVAWSGVDPKPFVIDRDEEARARNAIDDPKSFRQAVQIIRQLRSELEQARVSA